MAWNDFMLATTRAVAAAARNDSWDYVIPTNTTRGAANTVSTTDTGSAVTTHDDGQGGTYVLGGGVSVRISDTVRLAEYEAGGSGGYTGNGRATQVVILRRRGEMALIFTDSDYVWSASNFDKHKPRVKELIDVLNSVEDKTAASADISGSRLGFEFIKTVDYESENPVPKKHKLIIQQGKAIVYSDPDTLDELLPFVKDFGYGIEVRRKCILIHFQSQNAEEENVLLETDDIFEVYTEIRIKLRGIIWDTSGWITL